MTRLNAFGISQGQLQFTEPTANARINPPFLFDYREVEKKRSRLIDAVDGLCAATRDWHYREDDERDAVLTDLRDAGHGLVTAIAGLGGRDRLVDILSETTHLILQSDHHLPWEFLYLGSGTGPVDLGRFFGAHAVIGRPFDMPATALKRSRPSSQLRELGPLAARPADVPILLGYAEDDRLPSARSGRERDVFRDLSIQLTSLARLSAHRGSEATLSDFMAKSETLTHFNCHAERSAATGPGALFVSEAYKVDRASIVKLEVCANSIIVLNCCSGHTMRHDVTDTLATIFMEKRVSAVVATTASIEDRYATRWAKHFYEALWSGEMVPQSILKARMKMLEEPSPNPSAMLYAYLGRDSARARAPVVTS